MFKKLLLVLVLVFALALPLSAMDSGMQCRLIQGSKVIQVMPDRTMRGVIVPEEVDIKLGPEMPASMVERLNSTSGMDWTGGNVGIIEVDLGQGPITLYLFIKTTDVKNCER